MVLINGTSKKERINGNGTYYWNGHAWVLTSHKGATNGVDTIDGKGNNDLIYSGGGSDTLFGNNGNDLLNGGGGRDFLTGGKGADSLIGGGGGDTFIYNRANESADKSGGFSSWKGDTISGFTSMAENANVNQQDKIDLQQLASNIGHALTWSGNVASSHGVWQATTKNATFIKVDTDGDGKADMVIKIASKESLDSGDFLGVGVAVAGPAAPTIDLDAASDTGSSDTDNYTSDKTPTLTGTAEPLVKVNVYDGATFLGFALADESGNWSFTSASLVRGTHNFTAIAENENGNPSAPSSALAVTIDSAAATPIAVSATVTSNADDAEQALSNGRVELTSSDLEFGTDVGGAGSQLTAIRLHDLGIPVGAVITSAWIQFTARETDFEPAHIAIKAQDSSDAATFAAVYYSISDRATTASTASWAPDDWTAVNASGAAQKTVDISALVQEVVNKTGWSPDNAIAFIFDGDGRRNAYSFDTSAGDAPVLHVEFQIGDTNIAPVAANDSGIVTNEDTSVIINVLANDSDADGNTLSVAAAAPAAHGYVKINNDGTITYTPDENYHGADSFQYTLSDGHGGLAYGTVSLNVTSVDDTPEAINDLAVTDENTAVTINVLRNDRDVDGDTMTVSITGAAQHGTTVVNGDGTVKYTPDAAYSGLDTFTYKVSDGNGGTDTATATIHVNHGFDTVTFAAFGDLGTNNGYSLAVANMVKGFNPDFIVTLGDNFYAGAGNGFDDTVGKYYSSFIGNYNGAYGSGSVENRFFPALSEHEYIDIGLEAYEAYFSIPESSSHNERYYDFIQGSVHFFVLDTDDREPDGTGENSVQAQWLKAGLANSVTPWQIVISPEPPFSSGSEHGSEAQLQWDFEAWGADVVLSGDDHSYERILRDDNGDDIDMPYIVAGTGGAAPGTFQPTPVEGSVFQYNQGNGALYVTASESELTFNFYSITNGQTVGVLEDTYTMTHASAMAAPDEFLF